MMRLFACALTLASLTASARWYDSEGGIFLSRDSVGASSYLSTPNGMGPWSYANLSPAKYTDPDGRGALDAEMAFEALVAERGPDFGESREAQALGRALAYSGYRAGIHAAGAGVHWAAWKWTEAAEGMLSVPTSTPGVYTSTPESRIVASGLGAGVEFVGSLPVAIAGLGLLPEMLGNSPGEYRKARDEIRQGWVYGNEELYLTGLARMSGTVGLWAGVGAMGMSRAPILNEAPVSQLIRPGNWSLGNPSGGAVVYTGVPLPKYIGPRAHRIGTRTIPTDNAWGRYQIAKGRFPYEEGWRLSTGEPVWLDTPIGPDGIIEAKFTGPEWADSIYNLTELTETNPATAAKVKAKLIDQARRLNQLRAELELPAVEYRAVSPELAAEFTKLLSEAFPAETSAGTLRVKHAPWKPE